MLGAEIKIEDLDFCRSITQAEIKWEVQRVAKEITRDIVSLRPLALVILNGAYVFAADVLRHIDRNVEVCFLRLASYEGVNSSGKVTDVFGLEKDIRHREVIVIEDIVDTGLTMQFLFAYLKKKEVASVRVASLLVKKDSLQVAVDIHYHCFSIPNEFVIGYGLDYNGFGRQLPDIYTKRKG